MIFGNLENVIRNSRQLDFLSIILPKYQPDTTICIQYLLHNTNSIWKKSNFTMLFVGVPFDDPSHRGKID
jgi:hypothetical protein